MRRRWSRIIPDEWLDALLLELGIGHRRFRASAVTWPEVYENWSDDGLTFGWTNYDEDQPHVYVATEARSAENILHTFAHELSHVRDYVTMPLGLLIQEQRMFPYQINPAEARARKFSDHAAAQLLNEPVLPSELWDARQVRDLAQHADEITVDHVRAKVLGEIPFIQANLDRLDTLLSSAASTQEEER